MDAISGDFKYVLQSDGTAKVTEYLGKAGHVDVPDELDGHGVTGIDKMVFFRCGSLRSIRIPDGVTVMKENPFVDAENLTVILVSPDHPTLAVVDGALFSKPDKRLVCRPSAIADRAYAVPDGVEIIGEGAFSGCGSLGGVTIPDSVTRIEARAFYGCRSLTGITIPDGVTGIGEWAFYDCRSLTGVAIPDGVTDIGNGAFSNCGSLGSVTIPDSAVRIGAWAFQFCRGLTDIAIPDGVTGIGDGAFCFCSGLGSVTIPDSVTILGANPFLSCRRLTEIHVSADHPA